MVSFVMSLLVTAALLGIYHWYARRRPFGKPLTWGEAMVAAVFVFFIFFWAYGVVPHYWLTWADSELNWRADRFFQGPHLPIIGQEVDGQEIGLLADQQSGGWMPFTITYLVLRDLIAVGIYAVALGGNIWYWNHWQSRQARAEAATAEADAPSEFGRPLVREGAR